MQIVGLTGLPRSGKDTLANLMVARHSWIRMAYAEPLYEEVAEAFGVTVVQLLSNEWKTQPQARLVIDRCTDKEFFDVFEKAMDGDCLYRYNTSRTILQLWGTEYRRLSCRQSYWTEKMEQRIMEAYHNGHSRIVVSDVRVFLDGQGQPVYDEFECLDSLAFELGGSMKLVEVLREGTTSNGHSSDSRFPDHLIYAKLNNNRTPEELFFQAGKMGIVT
ncbi:hypothetical protein FDG94_gp124 [Pseudomonas phage SM1]|uniref:DNMP kinase n=2 Tax=Samunavirus TaxID=2560221 RepID=A0A0U3ECW8_9CAUD|nr:hypothetical protein FDG94_gp124 [Pseudomonas phage SM1]ALT58116.1 hypothetical protein SM1_0124 [Pseudomonas phage SM1]